jgi:hypothetical protein
VPFSTYNTSDIRVLSAALAEALRIVTSSAARPLTEIETANFSKKVTESLMRTFDLGERDVSALVRAALASVEPILSVAG